MRDALYATGRPMVFGICDWGDNQPWFLFPQWQKGNPMLYAFSKSTFTKAPAGYPEID